MLILCVTKNLCVVMRDDVAGQRYAMKEMEIKSRAMMEMAVAESEMLMNIMENVKDHPNIMQITKVFQV